MNIQHKPANDQRELDYKEFRQVAHEMGENESREAFERLWEKIAPKPPVRH